MANRRQKLGRQGENAAAKFLVEKGYKILEANYRTPYGEIDLVAKHQETTVFVEVKTRKSDRFGFPEVSVDQRKQERLFNISQYYYQQHPDMTGDWRIDVVSIRWNYHGHHEITHFVNAIS